MQFINFYFTKDHIPEPDGSAVSKSKLHVLQDSKAHIDNIKNRITLITSLDSNIYQGIPALIRGSLLAVLLGKLFSILEELLFVFSKLL